MSESRRYNWPIPQWNADWQSWQQRFEDLSDDIDSTVFSNMEGAKCIFNQLPNARVYNDSGTYKLEMLSDLILISRTYNMKITIDSSEDLVLIPYHLIGLTFTPGAVEEVTTDFELFNTAPIDSDVHIFGYITENYSINWFNGSIFAEGEDARRIFSFLAITGADTNKVKVSVADTNADFLLSKLTAGSNITLNILNPGGDEEIEIVAADAGVSYWSRSVSSPYFLYPSTDTDTIRIGDGTSGVPGIASKTYTSTGIRWDVTDSVDSIYFVGGGYDIASMYNKDYEQILSFVDIEDYDTAILRKKMSPGYVGDSVIFKIESEAGVNATDSQLILNSITTDDVSSLQSAIIEIESISSGLSAISTLKATTDTTAVSGTAEVQMIAEGYNTVNCLIRAHDLAAHTSSIVVLSDGGSVSNVSIKAEGSVQSNVEIGTDPSTGYAYTDVFAVSTDSLSSLEILSQSGGGGDIDAEIDIKAINNGADAYDDATVIVRSSSTSGYASVIIGDPATEDVIFSVSDSVFLRFDDDDKFYAYHSGNILLFSTIVSDDNLSVWEFNHRKYIGASEAAVEFNILGSVGTGGSRFTVNSEEEDGSETADIELYTIGNTSTIDIVSTSNGSGLATSNLYAIGNTNEGIIDIKATSTSGYATILIAAESSVSGGILVGSASTDIVAFTDINSSGVSGIWSDLAIYFSSSPSDWSTYHSNFGEVPLLVALNAAYSRIGTLTSSQIVLGNRSGSGAIEQDSNLTFNTNDQLLVGTGPDKIDMVANSLFVGGRLEVDDFAFFDESIYLNGSVVLTEDERFYLGSGGGTILQYSTGQTNEALMIGTNVDSRTLIITDKSAITPSVHNFALPARDDPTIAIMATDQINTKAMLLSWDRIVCGNTVTAPPTTQRIIAMGNSLALNGDMSDSLVIGSASTIDADDSLIVGDNSTIGQGSGHTSPLADKIVAVGDSLILDASVGLFIGTTIDAESLYSSAIGSNLTVAHDYASARGRYVETIMKGARHFGCDRYDTDNGSAMGIDGLVLVGSQTGVGTCVLHTTFGDASLYSFSIPDNRVMTIKWLLQTSTVGSGSGKSGLYAVEGSTVIWRYGGWTRALESTPNVLLDRGGKEGDDWTVSVDMTSLDNDDRVVVNAIVAGTCTTDLVHVFTIQGAVISQSAYYASS